MSLQTVIPVRMRHRLRRRLARAGFPLADFWRDRLDGRLFIGVTGSCGKSTTTNLVRHLLGQSGGCHLGHHFRNRPEQIARTLLTMRPWQRACVQELSAHAPGALDGPLRYFRPNVGVVLTVGDDHLQAYRRREAVAAEKGKVIAALPADGLAVLNADDPLVAAMAERSRAPVVTFGHDPAAMVRARDIAGTWPEPLSLTVEACGQKAWVQTNLNGAYWVYPVLAATAVALHAGVTLADCARRIATFRPLFDRMTTHETAEGAHIVLDTWKAPYWSLPAMIEFVAKARAARKIVIFGTLSDYSGKASKKYRHIARQAAQVADLVGFVGPGAHYVGKLGEDETGDRVLGFATARAASRWLGDTLATGDLVLVKSSAGDHLERLLLDRGSAVTCWRAHCKVKTHTCTTCPHRGECAGPQTP